MLAWVLNIFVPGTGLILCRREWHGFSLALLFGICGNVALAGWLIAPRAVPAWLTWLAVAIAGGCWAASQWLLHHQLQLLRHCAAALEAILNQARSALRSGDLAAARMAIESGAALDDENLDLLVVSAELCERGGDDHGRRTAWHKIIRLDRRGRYRQLARQALGELSGGGGPKPSGSESGEGRPGSGIPPPSP